MGYGLTAQTDDDYAPDIWVAGKAGENLLTHISIGLNIGAARIENDIDSTLDLAVNNPGGFAAAGAGGQNQNMVADAGPAFRSAVAPELHAGVCFGKLRHGRILCLHHLAVVVSGNTEQIVVGNPVALADGFGSLAQSFIVLEDLSAGGDVLQGNFVTVGNVLLRNERKDLFPFPISDGFPSGNIGNAGYHVVGQTHKQCIDFHIIIPPFGDFSTLISDFSVSCTNYNVNFMGIIY